MKNLLIMMSTCVLILSHTQTSFGGACKGDIEEAKEILKNVDQSPSQDRQSLEADVKNLEAAFWILNGIDPKTCTDEQAKQKDEVYNLIMTRHTKIGAKVVEMSAPSRGWQFVMGYSNYFLGAAVVLTTVLFFKMRGMSLQNQLMALSVNWMAYGTDEKGLDQMTDAEWDQYAATLTGSMSDLQDKIESGYKVPKGLGYTLMAPFYFVFSVAMNIIYRRATLSPYFRHQQAR